MSEEEIQEKLDRALLHDVYEWNKVARVKVKGNGRMAHNMHQLLYWCPKCTSEFTMRGEGDTIRCLKCGNGATLNEYFDFEPFNETCVIPDTIRVWFDMQRTHVCDQIQDENFEMREWAKLGILPANHYIKNLATSEIVGEGLLILNRQGLSYQGTKKGKPFCMHLPSYLMPTVLHDKMAWSTFQTYHKGEFLEFQLESQAAAKWLLAVEEIHRINGGRWRNYSPTILKSVR